MDPITELLTIENRQLIFLRQGMYPNINHRYKVAQSWYMSSTVSTDFWAPVSSLTLTGAKTSDLWYKTLSVVEKHIFLHCCQYHQPSMSKCREYAVEESFLYVQLWSLFICISSLYIQLECPCEVFITIVAVCNPQRSGLHTVFQQEMLF